MIRDPNREAAAVQAENGPEVAKDYASSASQAHTGIGGAPDSLHGEEVMAATPKTRKTANRKPAVRSKTRKRPERPPAKETSRDPRIDFTEEEWHDMVATAAYFRAESRGFENGSAADDWFEAEAQLREQLARAEDEADDRDEASLDLNDHERSGEAER